jgi:putative transposase
VEVVLEIADAEKKGKLTGMEPEKIKELFREAKDPEYRVVSIDPGVNNFCAVTNNFGEKPFLIKGGVIKSANRYYNKKLAEFRSEAERCNGKKQTRRIRKLTDKRNRILKDLMHKASRKITDWAAEHEADVVILGHNRFQKQRIRTGHVNNQTIVQIPHNVFAGMLRYKLEEEGILLVEQEESYTSKASFPGRDLIPTYGEDDDRACFSGKRGPHRYKGTYSAGGFRGLYMTDDGAIINSDLNASANIIRKAVPEAFDKGSDVCFDDVKIIVHPDSENRRLLRERQLEKNSGISRSRQNRLKKKRMLPA